MRVCIVDLCRSYTDHTSILYDTIYIYNYIHRSIGLSFIRNSIDADYAEAGAANHLTQLEPGQGRLLSVSSQHIWKTLSGQCVDYWDTESAILGLCMDMISCRRNVFCKSIDTVFSKERVKD